MVISPSVAPAAAAVPRLLSIFHRRLPGLLFRLRLVLDVERDAVDVVRPGVNRRLEQCAELVDLAQRDDQRVVHPVDRLAGGHTGLIVLGLRRDIEVGRAHILRRHAEGLDGVGDGLGRQVVGRHGLGDVGVLGYHPQVDRGQVGRQPDDAGAAHRQLRLGQRSGRTGAAGEQQTGECQQDQCVSCVHDSLFSIAYFRM